MKKTAFISLLAIAMTPSIALSGIPGGAKELVTKNESGMLKMPAFESRYIAGYAKAKTVDTDEATRGALNRFVSDRQGLRASDLSSLDRHHFTFEEGSHRLSEVSEEKLYRFLLGEYPSKVFVAGFADRSGGASENAQLAEKRAEYIKEKIQEFDPKISVITMSSNTFPADPDKGRRVDTLSR